MNAAMPKLVSQTVYRKEESLDLGCGFHAKVVVTAGYAEFQESAVKNHYCMLAHKFDRARIERWPVAVEPKLDGVRVLAHVDVTRAEVRFSSRNNNPFTSLDHLRESILQAVAAAGRKQIVLDGEVVGEGFFETMGQVRQKQGGAGNIVFWIFDALTHAEYHGGKNTPYRQRRSRVERIGATNHPMLKTVPSKLCESVGEIETAYAAALGAGHEGLMVKDVNAGYERKRSHAFMKIKVAASEDLHVVGAAEGDGRHAGRLGCLVCRYRGAEVRVGTGFSDAQRDALWRIHAAGKLLGRIAEVGYHECTSSGSLRHQRFIRFRDNLIHGKKE